jgi:hypothetical protein
MLQPTDEVEVRIHPVERFVNDVRRDGPELIEPITLPEPEVEGAAPVAPTLGF